MKEPSMHNYVYFISYLFIIFQDLAVKSGFLNGSWDISPHLTWTKNHGESIGRLKLATWISIQSLPSGYDLHSHGIDGP